MVRIDISNRALLVYGGLFVLFLSVGFVIAFNSGGPPSVMGHSAEELEGVCLSNGTNCPPGAGDFTTMMFQENCADYATGDGTTFQNVCENKWSGSKCIDVTLQQWCTLSWCSADCFFPVKPTNTAHACGRTIDTNTFRVICGKVV
jgi:hypothetical protein